MRKVELRRKLECRDQRLARASHLGDGIPLRHLRRGDRQLGLQPGDALLGRRLHLRLRLCRGRREGLGDGGDRLRRQLAYRLRQHRQRQGREQQCGEVGNRAELGEFDALVIGLLLMAQFKGQIVVPDFGFYGRDLHSILIREERLIGGVDFLDQLPPKLRQLAVLMDTVPSGTTFEDGETNEYNDFVHAAMNGRGLG
jgi:hypothetical protein